jgi:hypothetical protein
MFFLNLFFIICLVGVCEKDKQFSAPLYNDVFYVSPNGDDNYSGSFDYPWATWQKAFTKAGPGDTVYIRGGIYYADLKDEYGAFVANVKGNKSNPVCIFNYPGEVPVLDCSRINSTSPKKGISLYNCAFYHLKGLTVTGVSQNSTNSEVIGFAFEKGGPYTIELCVSHGNNGAGFEGYDLDSIFLIKCDSYDNYDRFTKDYSGGQADGFVFCFASNHSYTYYSECRSWFNSDDGFDCWTNEGVVVFDRCWAFNNGRGEGDGCGFKLGRTNGKPMLKPQRILKNCMAFGNRFIGFNQNDGNVSMAFYNNIAFDNDKTGFSIGQFNNPIIVRNNISYKNGSIGYFLSYNNDHNSWNPSLGVTVTDNDFISVDSIGVSGMRQSEGSLPILNFLKLIKGSDLINAGVDVGLPYRGMMPDLGPFEKE